VAGVVDQHVDAARFGDHLRGGGIGPFLRLHVHQPSMPVSLVYQRSRQLSPRVRVFVDWAVREFAKRQAGAADQ
jgi:DNA-binding transcriptional LysR family regulator